MLKIKETGLFLGGKGGGLYNDIFIVHQVSMNPLNW